MSKKQQRRNELITILRKHGQLPVKELSSMLQVSEMTVRRDLEALQNDPEEMMLASSEIAEDMSGYNLLDAFNKANKQKDAIGHFAASLIQPNDVIIIDIGSTTDRMLPHIPQNHNVTVLCYSANVLLQLRYRKDINILFCGGVYHPNSEMCESPEGISFIKRNRANKVFLAAAGVHESLGVTCVNQYEVLAKEAAIGSSQQKILLADSTKFGKLKSSYFCELDVVDTIVTDKDLSPEWQDIIKEKHIELIMV